MCLYPKIIKNRKYLANKKNRGVIPIMTDERVKYVPVGCGKCIECRKQKARNWQIRLLEEIKQNKCGKFITLTFSNESIQQLASDKYCESAQGYELDNAIATLAIRRFLERWRKKYKKSIKHWLVTELGHNGTENVHLHGIIWTKESYDTIHKIWQYGFIWPKPESKQKTWVNSQTVNYIIKYVTKIDNDHKYYKSIVLTSPGIGANYTNSIDFKKHTYNDTQTIDTYRTGTGHKIALPIYYRNKAFTEEEREKLWLQRLDKNERWICGQKIKADDHDGYWKLINWHRDRNQRLGYGNDEKDWNREQYEIERRNILNEKRKQDAINKENIRTQPTMGGNENRSIKGRKRQRN